MVLAGILGLAAFVIDLFRTWAEHGCFLATEHGGDAGSVPTLLVVGAILWLTFSAAAWRRRRTLFLLLIGFLAAYVIALMVIAALAPSIWGPLTCQQQPM
jgi:hypothetical protein